MGRVFTPYLKIMSQHTTTIAAIATPPGQGGVGIIRISGPKTSEIATILLGKTPTPRYAHFTAFHGADHKILDQGLALYFPKPHSFTGEDVLELHTHGSPIVLDLLLKHLLTLDISMARPGEFSERAFLNGKVDLVQAEAIADLISATSEQAAFCALRSLQGEFSQQIHKLLELFIELRVYIEAGLDFPEEDIDLLADQHVLQTLKKIDDALNQIKNTAKQGVLLRDGMHVVIAGQPNVGKSSLLNRLSGQDSAIVTDIPGTTRDVLREHIHIDGLPLHIIDTAGIRETADLIELEGIRRAQKVISEADQILWVVNAENANFSDLFTGFDQTFPLNKLTVICNKIDLCAKKPSVEQHPKGYWLVYLSAKTGEGIDLLRTHLKSSLGFLGTTESTFIARRRHLDALERAGLHRDKTQLGLQQHHAVELIAEELRLAQQALSEITGEFLPDDLLGEIFSRFCIGK